MEKEELKQVQAAMEEQEADETTPLVRKSRNGDSKIAAVSAVNGEVRNGVSERNGQAIKLENGAEDEEMIISSVEEESNGVIENEEETRYVLERETEFLNGEQKNEENETGFVNGEHKNEQSDGVLENVLEFINREDKIEEIHGVLENEIVFTNKEHKIEEIHGILENELNFINREHKIEEIHGVLENELNFMNREHKIEEIHRVLENELNFINREHKIKDIHGVLENELNFIDMEHKIEGIHGVLENGSEFINGEQKIYKSDRVLQIVTGAINKELKMENLVFHDKDEGVKSSSTHIVEEHILKGPALIKFDISEINDTRVEEIEENGISGLNHQHSDSSFEGDEGSHYEPSKEIESEEIDLINEDDLEITEFDVERVIKKQTTLDLYCPNCKSCITKRVILRKRKRRIRIPGEDVKRNKTGITVEPELGTVSTQSPVDQVHLEGGVDIDDAQEPAIDREPDIFRCLSCFSFFIPTGDGFKLFKRNWFTNIFASNKHVTTVEQGSSSQTNAKHVYTALPSSDSADQSSSPAHPSEGLDGASGINITLESRDTSLRFPNLKPSANGIRIGVGGKLDMKATEAIGLEETTGMNNTLESRDAALRFPNLKPSVNGNITIGVGGNLDMKATEAADATIQQFDVCNMDQPKESKPIQEGHIYQDIDLSVAAPPMKTQVNNVESAEDNISFPQQNGLKLLITPNKGSPILQNIEEGVKTNQAVQTRDNEAIQLSPPSASVIQASDVDGKLNITVSIPREEQDVTATIITKSVVENKNVDPRSRDGDEVYPPEVPQQIITETKIEVHPNEPIKTEFSSALLDTPVAKGNDTVITIDRQLPVSYPIAEDIILPAAAATASQSDARVSTADRGERKIEVIKSIVYGGLAESITSLSVVSSAAGGDAATLNVLALGAANLIGGLFIISHNLWDLRCDRDEQVSNQITEQKDRYRELLGRRQNFVLHAVVAIISYIIIGLVSPVVYGFSFRVSDDKQMKLVATAAASLVCILILAVAKAYVQRPPKPYWKTVSTFVILGIMVSGVSFAAGALVERLLENLGLFEANSVAPNLLVQERTPVSSGWASH